MEILFYLSVFTLLAPFPFMAGYIAKGLGRNYWFWFLLSIILPWLACFILVCLPDKSNDQINEFTEYKRKQLNKPQTAEVCDATGVDSSNTPDYKK